MINVNNFDTSHLVPLLKYTNQLFREQIEKLKGESQTCIKDISSLRTRSDFMVLVAMLAVCPEICGMQPLDLSATKTPQVLQDRQIIEVETELFIGPPDSRDTACPQNHKS
ncbi:hypothetical protein NC653_001290 [Populus alba x Populus x berolinensis]|uniref:Uncharacterized protein n=1 Tax=Populus alba x Populus x berolinensis TaxID=444605 RepID=A0AAD6RKM5_9ROSI|nr:hypothetical protein NC653_001290 [Populus alba x Populus x berolinensis]